MKPDIAEKLRDINQQFYDQIADSFAASRQRPQPGFTPLLECLPHPCRSLLDVGCGDGRLGRFTQRKLLPLVEAFSYVGVDFSAELLAIAAANTDHGQFWQRDMLLPGFLDGLGQFDAIACLAALHHIPGLDNRINLLQELKTHLTANGRLLLSTWQFATNERQRRKITDWSAVGLTTADVDAHDYLLTWQRQGQALRYAAFIDAAQTAVLAEAVGLEIITQFYSDGKEGDLSLYTVMGEALTENN